MVEIGASGPLLTDNGYAALTSPAFDPKKVKLRSMTATERLGRPFLFEAKVISQEPIRQLAPMLGQPATVAMKLEKGATRHFHGIIARSRYVGIDDELRPERAAAQLPPAGLARLFPTLRKARAWDAYVLRHAGLDDEIRAGEGGAQAAIFARAFASGTPDDPAGTAMPARPPGEPDAAPGRHEEGSSDGR